MSSPDLNNIHCGTAVALHRQSEAANLSTSMKQIQTDTSNDKTKFQLKREQRYKQHETHIVRRI